jgi:hypothetical protein
MGLLFGNKFSRKNPTLLCISKHFYSIKLMCWIDPIYWILKLKILYRIVSNSCWQYTALLHLKAFETKITHKNQHRFIFVQPYVIVSIQCSGTLIIIQKYQHTILHMYHISLPFTLPSPFPSL